MAEPSLLDMAKGLRPAPQGWFKRLPPDAQKELLALREAVQSGALDDKPKLAIYRLAVQRFGSDAMPTPRAFDTWLESTE